MAILLKHPDWRMPSYRITKGDGNGQYIDVCCLNEDLYDESTGEPINDEVREMDNCIDKKTWNPEKFDELWNKLNKSGYFVADLYD